MLDVQLSTWYVTSTPDNDDYIVITGIDSVSPIPELPPSQGDLDGDGIPNHEDDDVDGDGIDNEADGDIDGDGIPNEDDDTPNGPVGNCDTGFTAVDFSAEGDGSNVICVPTTPGGGIDCSGFACNPLIGDQSPGIGIPSVIAIWGFTAAQANIIATIFLFLISFVIVIVPAWRFGYDPSAMMVFVLIMLDLSLAVVLGWVDSLYFFAVIAAIAVGGGLKFSGVL